jgi:hypothetical protein
VELHHQVIGVYIDFGGHFNLPKAETVNGGRSAVFGFDPQILKVSHQGKDGADHLPEHRAQMGSGVFGSMDFGPPHEGLTNSNPLVDGKRRHPDIDPEIGRCFVPSFALQISLADLSAETEIPADGLTDSPAV